VEEILGGVEEKDLSFFGLSKILTIFVLRRFKETVGHLGGRT